MSTISVITSLHELDCLIAVKVMGYDIVVKPLERLTIAAPPEIASRINGRNVEDYSRYTLPSYSTSWDAAGELLEMLRTSLESTYDSIHLVVSASGYDCRISRTQGDDYTGYSADSMPTAICLAALQTKGVDAQLELGGAHQ
jgi:hypothetical protein